MANHPSAIKRAKQNEKRRMRGLHIKSTVKTSIKNLREAIEGKDLEAAKKALSETIPLIQKASSKGIFQKNTSSRKISRLTRSLNTLKTKPA